MQTPFDRLELRASAMPGEIALEQEGHGLTYRDLVLRYRGCSEMLAQLGVGLGHSVLVLQRDPFELVIAVLAVLHRQAVYSVLERGRDVASARATSRISRARHALGGPELVGEFLSCSSWKVARARELESSLLLHDETQGACAAPLAPYPGFLSSLPGSDGAPRAVVRSAAPLERRVAREVEHGDAVEGTRFLQWSGPQSDAFLADLFVALGCGGRLLLPAARLDRANPRHLDAILSAGRVNALHLGSTAFRRWAHALSDRQPPRDLRLVRVPRAGVLPSDVSRFVQRFGASVSLRDREARKDWRASGGSGVRVGARS